MMAASMPLWTTLMRPVHICFVMSAALGYVVYMIRGWKTTNVINEKQKHRQQHPHHQQQQQQQQHQQQQKQQQHEYK